MKKHPPRHRRPALRGRETTTVNTVSEPVIHVAIVMELANKDVLKNYA